MPEQRGGCLCGQVRYTFTAAPVATRICWCRDCQHLSSNGTVNAVVPSASLQVLGEPSEYASTADSGHAVRRRFCGRCGSHLFADSSGRPGLTVVRVGTLDDPSAVRPTGNIWCASAPSWACLDGTLTADAKQPKPLPPPAPADLPPA